MIGTKAASTAEREPESGDRAPPRAAADRRTGRRPPIARATRDDPRCSRPDDEAAPSPASDGVVGQGNGEVRHKPDETGRRRAQLRRQAPCARNADRQHASTNNSRRSNDIAPSSGRPSVPRIAYAVGAGDSEPRPALRQPLNHCVEQRPWPAREGREVGEGRQLAVEQLARSEQQHDDDRTPHAQGEAERAGRATNRRGRGRRW